MKILAICSIIDLKRPCGMTPPFWQLFKSLHELGVEVVVVPYIGSDIESLWWASYSNPNRAAPHEVFANQVLPKTARADYFQTENQSSGVSVHAAMRSVVYSFRNIYSQWKLGIGLRRWKKYIEQLFDVEKNIDAVIFFSIFPNQLRDLPQFIKCVMGVPVFAYDADLTSYLKTRETYLKSPYYEANLDAYDGFIVNSEGIIPKLEEMGLRNIEVLHFAVDPTVFAPINIKKDIDVCFYGFGSKERQHAINEMITEPSRILKEKRFLVAGKLNMDLGLAKSTSLSFHSQRVLVCRSKINLNITRETFAKTYLTSTSRPFELSSLESCIVSNPCLGLDKMFEPNKEIYFVNDKNEAIEMFEWLLSSDEIRRETGKRARQRVLKEHTYLHRAKQLLNYLTKTSCS